MHKTSKYTYIYVYIETHIYIYTYVHAVDEIPFRHMQRSSCFLHAGGSRGVSVQGNTALRHPSELVSNSSAELCKKGKETWNIPNPPMVGGGVVEAKGSIHIEDGGHFQSIAGMTPRPACIRRVKSANPAPVKAEKICDMKLKGACAMSCKTKLGGKACRIENSI